MQKANLDNVTAYFENAGWKVEVDYDPRGAIQLNAKNESGDFFIAYFAYRQKDMEHAEFSQNKYVREDELEDLYKFAEIMGDRINYHGSPTAVNFYEAEFGASSIADLQTIKGQKTVAMVEEAFKKAGYSVEIDIDNQNDYATDIEMWNVKCFQITPYNSLVACHGYSTGWAKQLGEAQIAAASAANQTLKTQDFWFYYGSPDAIEIFESIKGGQIEVLFEAKPAPAGVSQLEAAFKAAGYTVTIIPIGESTMMTCTMPSPFSMLTGMLCSSPAEAKTNGPIYGASASALNMEVKYNGNWFYYGNPDAVKIFEMNC